MEAGARMEKMSGVSAMECKKCKSKHTRKHGTTQIGTQRYRCNNCGKTFTFTEPKFSNAIKAVAVKMYLNNVGFRKIALFVGASHQAVQNWVRAAHISLENRTDGLLDEMTERPDIIELDEIYTYVKKTKSNPNMDCVFTN